MNLVNPDKTKLLLMGSPCYSLGDKPISLFCSNERVRTFPGGVGNFRVGGYLQSYLGKMG